MAGWGVVFLCHVALICVLCYLAIFCSLSRSAVWMLYVSGELYSSVRTELLSALLAFYGISFSRVIGVVDGGGGGYGCHSFLVLYTSCLFVLV